MPVEVKGLDETLKALRAFEPDMAKNLNKEVRAALTPVTKKAQGFVPGDIPGLSNWGFSSKGKKITAQSSAFAQIGRFPKFNASIVRRGIKISLSKTRPNRSGFSTFYRISNITAAGAIMETAGRKTKGKGSGVWFIDHMPQGLSGSGKMRGSVLYKAFNEDQGKALAKTLKALDTTIAEFQKKAKAHSSKVMK